MHSPDIIRPGNDYGSRWALHEQPDGTLLIDKQSLYYVRLSGLATELLLQFSKGRTLDDVVNLRAFIDGEPRETVREALANLLAAHPLTAEWLEGAINSEVRISGSGDVFIPVSVALQLTNGCNLKCPFCYAASGTHRDKELTANDWIGVIKKLAVRGTLNVTLTGGEPTLLRDFQNVLCAASGYMSSVEVFTNGYAWSDKMIGLVAHLGNVDIQISVDGLPRTHDEIRGGRNAFSKSIRTIERFVNNGVDVDVAMTATPRNYSQVQEVAQLLDQTGVRMLRVGQVQSIGRADGRGEFILSLDQKQEVEEQIDAFIHSNSRLEVLPWSGCESTEELVRQTGFDAEFLVPGYLSWYILSDGRVTPCQLEEVSILGDIRLNSVEEIGSPENLQLAVERVYGCHCMTHVSRSVEPTPAYMR